MKRTRRDGRTVRYTFARDTRHRCTAIQSKEGRIGRRSFLVLLSSVLLLFTLPALGYSAGGSRIVFTVGGDWAGRGLG